MNLDALLKKIRSLKKKSEDKNLELYKRVKALEKLRQCLTKIVEKIPEINGRKDRDK